MRRKVIAGNWKMNKNATEAILLAIEIADQVAHSPHDKIDTIISPASTFLFQCCEIAKKVAGLSVAAQNCHWEKEGAFTGEVSLPMIASTGARYVIIGHSERRAIFGETNEMILLKLKAILAEGLIPILCVGETREQRNNHQQTSIVAEQLETTMCKLNYQQEEKVIVAYEPVWAIGTGLTATPEQAQEMHVVIRNVISNRFGHAHGKTQSILYGGSCNPTNAASLFACQDVDGALIGGASLKSEDFMAIRNCMINSL